MNCPVVATIKELYGSYEYSGGETSIRVVTPSGFHGGGSTTQSVCIDDVTFYQTTRKLQFARAKLNSSNRSEFSIIEDTKYFERMFSDYYGKTSIQVYKLIIEPVAKRVYSAVTRSIDIIDIMEAICSSVGARDYPDGMSLPTIELDSEIIESIPNNPKKFASEVNRIIDYANKVCVGGIRTKIEPLAEPDFTLRDFTFSPGDYDELLKLDMEVADYALKVEKLYVSAIAKLGEIATLCQSIIDL